MKLRDYIDGLNELVKEMPEALDFDVVSASDDEGNSYHIVNFGPSIGHFDTEERDFLSAEGWEPWDDNDEMPENNAVCIN